MATEISSATQIEPTAQHPVERDTIPKIFFGAVDDSNRPDAMLYKEGGRWRSLSHSDVAERVAQLAAALQELGIERGDRIALLSENRPEWAVVDYAVLGLGAVDVPIYATLPPNQITFLLNDCAARAVFVSTREQLAKILEIRDQISSLEHVIAFDDPGNAAGVERFADVLERGRRALAEGRGGGFRERALEVDRDDLATLIYTSGTTGDPKGVMLTHFNLASNVAATSQHGTVTTQPGDVALSFLPLSHVFERMVDYVYWDEQICIAYAESIDKVVQNLGEVRPHLMVSVPRVFDKVYTRVMGATGIKRALVMWAKRVGETVAEERFAGREPTGMLALQFRLANKLVFSKLQALMGGRIRFFVSGGAPLSAEVAKFFFAAGLPVYEGYGLTETSPVLTANREGAARIGTVGQPIPGVEVRISDNGEIIARGPNVMQGYWKNPGATSEVIDDEGWFHTGDVGEFDADGFLRITDRIKNLIVTAGGKNIAPAPIENAAAMSPYVAQVVVLGDRRAFPTMLVVPDFENLAAWAKEQGIEAADPQRLAEDPRVRELIERDTLGRLESFARYEQPKKIAIIAEEFTIDAGLLTPKMSIKRRAVEDRYREMIEEMYSGT
jgi:long-chain acyl-CoA synthetase